MPSDERPKRSTDNGIAKLSSSLEDDENPHEKATALNPLAGLLAATSMISDSGAPPRMAEHATLDLPQAIASAKAKHAATGMSTPPLPLGGSNSEPPLADDRPTARPPPPAADLVKGTLATTTALDAPRAKAPVTSVGRGTLLVWVALATCLAVAVYVALRNY